MPQIVIIVLLSWLAGVAAFLGGVVALFEGTAETEGKRELVHGVVAFGGGILVAAVAFAFVPPAWSTFPQRALQQSSLSGESPSVFWMPPLANKPGAEHSSWRC